MGADFGGLLLGVGGLGFGGFATWGVFALMIPIRVCIVHDKCLRRIL